MKDLLVDNTVAKNFSNPLDVHYKELIQWLFKTGVLVVTQRLLVEYLRTASGARSNTSMPALFDHLLREGRLKKFDKKTLGDFAFTKRIQRALRSNKEDHDNIKAVMLSVRKFALSHDVNLCHDINNFPGHNARAERRPEDLPYS
jgi:hypothetical protein